MITGITIETLTKITFIPDSAIVRVVVDRTPAAYQLSIWLSPSSDTLHSIKGTSEEILQIASGSAFCDQVAMAIKKLKGGDC